MNYDELFDARLEARKDAIYADELTLGRYAIRFTQQADSIVGKLHAAGTHGYVHLDESPSDLFTAWLEDVVSAEVRKSIDDDRFDHETRDAA